MRVNWFAQGGWLNGRGSSEYSKSVKQSLATYARRYPKNKRRIKGIARMY